MKLVRTITTLTLLAGITNANAQEFGVELNGGLQGMQHSPKNASNKLQPGGGIGLNYTFHFGKRWGLFTGITAGSYLSKSTLNNGTVLTSNEVDEEGSAFEYRIKANNYEEKQSFLAAGIPIMAQYHTTGKTQWYLNAGTKILFPFNGKTKGSADQLALTGYYPDFNVEFTDLPQHGFGTINNWKNDAKLDLKPTATISAATGVSFMLSETMRLYTGVYFDYGVNDMRKNKDEGASLVTYSSTGVEKAEVKGMLPASSNAHLLAYGVQVRLGFTKKKAAQPVYVDVPVAIIETPKPKDTVVATAPPPPPPAPVVEEKPAPAPAPKPTITATEEEVVKQPVTFYTLGKTSVPEGMKSHLDSVANILQQYPDLKVSIVGHTCDIGSEKENEKIGTQRALAVAEYLKSKGVAADRIETSTVGEAQPIVPNDSKRHRGENRRVTITVQ
ncbi:OmpA family protein [Pseudoflavitalea sp. G-6-1-2]|uniref:OmpA family protein n=1 Tax=Pseudoflavitalea sp. G-6-1-2 TaxID=2728841 RepID=UPI00146D5BC2|nr:OmpA family protein [Pseudoflavitalea sp. G-6-1-2]NML23707.1 OmpA family protein [Pseudoflavitalea sp. G-6-1-2]